MKRGHPGLMAPWNWKEHNGEQEGDKQCATPNFNDGLWHKSPQEQI